MITTGIVAIIVALITSVLGPYLIERTKAKLHKKITDFRETIEYNELIDAQLDEIIEELKCDRIWIAQFHNGGHFYPTGRSIQKFSIFYEKVSPGTTSIQNTFQNIPVSLFSKPISKIYNEDEFIILDKNKSYEYGLSPIIKEYPTESFYLWALHDLDNKFIGMLSISYNREIKKFSLEEWKYIRQKIGVLGSLLATYLNK